METDKTSKKQQKTKGTDDSPVKWREMKIDMKKWKNLVKTENDAKKIKWREKPLKTVKQTKETDKKTKKNPKDIKKTDEETNKT